MKKSIFTGLLILATTGFAFSQAKITKTYPVEKGQTIALKFDYPKLIHISTWDKKEIAIEATVKINEGKNNNAFTLQETRDGGRVSISNKIDLAQIPQTYYIVEKGIKTRFDSKDDMESYRKENERKSPGISSYQQRDIEITIDIKLPANVSTEVESIYGMVELADFNGPVKVDAKYGGIDASLNESKVGQLKLTNRYGKIYSNIVLKPTEQIDKNFFTSITASPGKGPSYDISSSYGNIYVRTAKN